MASGAVVACYVHWADCTLLADRGQLTAQNSDVVLAFSHICTEL
jgi:hypothetical protein